MKITILVAAHKPYFMPHDDMYLPVRVGSALADDTFGFQPDNTGDNISFKNPYYCELTALYWAWKNLSTDYLGLVHYRRHFSLRRNSTNWESVLTTVQAEWLLQNSDVVLPKKRRYWIETIASHYGHTHDRSHLKLTRDIIAARHPDCIPAFDRVMRSTSAHMFNMFLMRKSLADEYCAWLFDILFQLEQRVDFAGLDPFQARLLSRVSELLLDVWIRTRKLNYKEISYVLIGPYNFRAKAVNFLKAMLLDKKYTQSF